MLLAGCLALQLGALEGIAPFALLAMTLGFTTSRGLGTANLLLQLASCSGIIVATSCLSCPVVVESLAGNLVPVCEVMRRGKGAD